MPTKTISSIDIVKVSKSSIDFRLLSGSQEPETFRCSQKIFQQMMMDIAGDPNSPMPASGESPTKIEILQADATGRIGLRLGFQSRKEIILVLGREQAKSIGQLLVSASLTH